MKYFVLFIFIAGLIFCISKLSREKEPTPIINKDESYYMQELKKLSEKCIDGNTLHTKSLKEKIRLNIPSKYYVHVRIYESADGNYSVEYACIDTTLPEREELLEKAKQAMAGK